MSHIHLNLGNDILRAEVRAHVACLAQQLPNAEFNLVITGASLAALLGNTGDLMVNAPPPPARDMKPVAEALAAAVAASAPAPAATGERFRRTKDETEAGLSVDQAKAFRAQTAISDPAAYAASLVGAAEDAVDATLAASPPPPPPPPPAPPPAPEAPKASGPVSEQDVRDAAALAVKGGKKDDVLKLAADYGVKNWKELDPSKYGEVLSKLTGLMVVS